MAVAVIGDGHRGMPHVGAEGLRVDAGRDHQGSEGVTALVKREWFELCRLPGLCCPPHRRPIVERLGSRAEHESVMPSQAELVWREVFAKRVRDGHVSNARPALRSDEALFLVP